MLKWFSWLSVQLLVSAQIMISWFTCWSLTLGSVLIVQSLLGVLLSLSLCPSPAHVLSLSLSLSKQISFKKKTRVCCHLHYPCAKRKGGRILVKEVILCFSLKGFSAKESDLETLGRMDSLAW